MNKVAKNPHKSTKRPKNHSKGLTARLSIRTFSDLYSKFIEKFDVLIEHRLLYPICILIIALFIITKFSFYLIDTIQDIKESSQKKRESTPVKVNVSGLNLDFDFDEDQILEHRVKSKENLFKILVDFGAAENDILAITDALKKAKLSNALSVGSIVEINYKLRISYNAGSSPNLEASKKETAINKLRLYSSNAKEIIISKNPSGAYEAKEIKKKTISSVVRYYGAIKNGLFIDGVNSGISPTTMMNMINLYGHDVDFQRDVKRGDKFEMLVESFYTEDGKKIRDGDVLYSSLNLRDRTVTTYLYRINGQNEYFDSKGNSIKKSLLRTPINGARISSGFGMRHHPILGYSKMHKGMDFAAPRGVPILAAGDGVIVYRGVFGGYGNYVRIKHNSEYQTAYAHTSRFARNLKVGSKVKQGQVIAYVGTTGRSTGPHLHYEIIYKGKQINPRKVKSVSGIRLSGKGLLNFEARKREIDRYRENIPNQFLRSAR